MNTLRPVCFSLFAVLLGSAARADFLDGRCVNSLAQGVAGVNLDAKDLSGNDITLANDGTDVNGFFHVTIPPGTFQITFKPPQPPASTDLVAEFGPVTVSGTTNIGTIPLLPGVSLTGTVINPSLAGVPSVNFDVIELSSGQNVDLLFDTTNALGIFSFASLAGSIELRLDPAPSGQVLAPKALQLVVPGNTNLGTIQLAQGFVLAALVRNPSNQPVAGCNLDVEVSGTGEDLYTPGDNSNSTGLVDVIVPAGTFDCQFCPPANLGLASKVVGGIVVGANTSLGIVSLQSGFALSGQVRDSQNVPVAGTTVRLQDTATGLPVPVCHNSTDANGNYSTVVPAGNFTVCFVPPASQALGAACVPNVAVGGATTVNGTLPLAFARFCPGDGSLSTRCPCGNFGVFPRGCLNSQAGNTGALLVASGTTHPDTAVLTASDVLPTALCIFLQGDVPVSVGAVFGDGVRCVGGSLKRIAVKNAAGGVAPYPVLPDPSISQRSASLGDPIPLAATRWYQTYYRDPVLTFCPNPPGSSFNVTNGIQIIW